MEYMLYKQAIKNKNDNDPEKPTSMNKKQMARLIGALGGGAAGYLGTRYILGLKGFIPGLMGAGAGAAVGTIGAQALQDAGAGELSKKEREEQEAIARQLELANRSHAENVVKSFKEGITDPVTVLGGSAVGTFGGHRLGKKLVANARTEEARNALRAIRAEIASGGTSPDLAAISTRLSNQYSAGALEDALEGLRRSTSTSVDPAREVLENMAHRNASRSFLTSAGRWGSATGLGLLLGGLAAGPTAKTGYNTLQKLNARGWLGRRGVIDPKKK